MSHDNEKITSIETVAYELRDQVTGEIIESGILSETTISTPKEDKDK